VAAATDNPAVHVNRRARLRPKVAVLLLALAALASGCTEPGATSVPASEPAVAVPSASPAPSDGDSPFPSGDSCSIATACPSPTE
jgi:hypothetical protein